MAVNFHDNNSYPINEEDYSNLTNSLNSMLSDLDKVIVSEYNKRDAVKKLKEVEEREKLINSINSSSNLIEEDDKNVFDINIDSINSDTNIYEDIPKEYYNTSELGNEDVVVQDINYIESISFDVPSEEDIVSEFDSIEDNSDIDSDFKLSINSIDMDENKIFIINQDGMKDLDEIDKEPLTPVISDLDDIDSSIQNEVIDNAEENDETKGNNEIEKIQFKVENPISQEPAINNDIASENEIHYFNDITKEESNNIRVKFNNIMGSLNKNGINTSFLKSNNEKLFNSMELKSLVDDTINKINKSK